MDKFSIVNLNEFTWQLNVALMGGVFAVFSLIYNEYYIYYGLFTFAFGVFAHVVYKTFEWFFLQETTNQTYYWLTHVANVILTLAWFKVLTCFY
jgi:hypothetical protein